MKSLIRVQFNAPFINKAGAIGLMATWLIRHYGGLFIWIIRGAFQGGTGTYQRDAGIGTLEFLDTPLNRAKLDNARGFLSVMQHAGVRIVIDE